MLDSNCLSARNCIGLLVRRSTRPFNTPLAPTNEPGSRGARPAKFASRREILPGGPGMDATMLGAAVAIFTLSLPVSH